MSKNTSINVQGYNINIEDDFISLTDMAKSQSEEVVIIKWLSSKSTIEFLGAWESINNPNFNSTEYGIIRNEAGSNNFVLSVKQWREATGAKGIYAKIGKYGGTYAHKDIAFEFGTWISPVFKLYLIKEFQRLKEIESNAGNIEWNVRRILSKAQYHIQTDAVKHYKLPALNWPQEKHFIAYAEEGDILNLAMFGFTAKQWREANPELSAKGHNAREYASINELAVLSSLEGINAEMIKSGQPFEYRLQRLTEIAKEQLATLGRINPENNLRKNIDGSFQPYFDKGMFPEKARVIEQPKKENEGLSFGEAIKKISKAGKPKG